MALIDKETIRAEIERQRQFIGEWFTEGDNTFYDGQDDAYHYILSFLDSLPEQPETKPMNIPSAGGGMSTTPPSYKLDVKPEQPVVKKSNALFDKCVKNCDPAVMKEVSDNVDKMLGRQPVEGLDKELERYWNWVTGFQPSFAVLELTKEDLAKVARHFYELGQCKKADVSVDLDKAIQDWMLEIDGKYAILTHPPVDRVILETAQKFYDLGLNSKK